VPSNLALRGIQLLCLLYSEDAVQGIAEGTLQEAHAEDGEVKAALGDGSFRGVAVHRATALLLDEARVPADLALRFLPWLLTASSTDSLAVLKVSKNKQSLPCLAAASQEDCSTTRIVSLPQNARQLPCCLSDALQGLALHSALAASASPTDSLTDLKVGT